MGLGLVLVLATMALAAGCGSSSVVGTSGGPATTQAGPLTADLDCGSGGQAMAGMSTTAPSATAAAALHDYLTTSPAAASLRTATFVPAQTPRGFGPVQAVTAETAGVTAASAPRPPAVDQVQFFAHQGPDGRVTAVFGAVHLSRGWAAGTFAYCQPGTRPPDGATATTIQAAATTTSTTAMSGP